MVLDIFPLQFLVEALPFVPHTVCIKVMVVFGTYCITLEDNSREAAQQQIYSIAHPHFARQRADSCQSGTDFLKIFPALGGGGVEPSMRFT